MDQNQNEIDLVRLDKWLWAARFYKTRAIAIDAINGGKVHLNGERTKPGRLIKIGDKLKIRRGHYEFVIQILMLSKQRRPAKEAQLLYEETPESIEIRSIMQDHLKVESLYTRKSRNRPNKQQRRRLIKIKKEI